MKLTTNDDVILRVLFMSESLTNAMNPGDTQFDVALHERHDETSKVSEETIDA